MRFKRAIGCGLLLCGVVILGSGRPLIPLEDQVEVPLVPAGISELEVTVAGGLAYLFDEDDDSKVVQVLGDFSLTLGDAGGQSLRSQDAVLWISEAEHEGRRYRRLDILLWRDAQIRELGGTLTTGPALFVSLSTFGKVTLNVDDVAFDPPREDELYQRGGQIRAALAEQAGLLGHVDVSLRVFDASGLEDGEKEEPEQRWRLRVEGPTALETRDGERVFTAMGGVYLARGNPGKNNYIEIRADAMVVFLSSNRMDAEGGPTSGAASLGGVRDPEAAPEPGKRVVAPQRRAAGNEAVMQIGFGEEQSFEAVYLEGDVVITQGDNMIRGDRLYYDPTRSRALILDGVVRTLVRSRGLPLYLRAKEIRQLSANEFGASEAMLSTSEFHTPHYHIGAGQVELVDESAPDPASRETDLRAGRFRVRNATLNFEGVPVLYWPYIQGNLDTSETSIRSVRSGYSDDFGVEVETEWNLFNLVGLAQPEGFETTLSLDYFSHRGPAIGVDAEYERDNYFGLLRSYLLDDRGEDTLGREREDPSFQGERGRFLWRHRQYLEDDWEASLELSYISDRNFLEEFFEREFDLEKEQETLFYLKKQVDNWAVTGLLQWRILPFTSQTEHMPDLAAYWIGEPVGDFATWFSEYRLGVVRRRGADQNFFEFLTEGEQVSSGTTGRSDTRQEVTFPLDLGPVRLVPFAVARGSTWTEGQDEGGMARAFASYGVRGSMYLSRVYPEAKSELLDINGIRHIIKPDIVAWASHSNVDSDELYPFTYGVESIDEVDGVTLGLRQRWQTKRGEGENFRLVDVFTWDLELGVFNDSVGDREGIGFTSYSRPENSIARNHISSSFIWRVNDRTAILNETNYDLNDQSLDVLNFSVAVERTPRLSYLVGYRYVGETSSNLLGFGANYRLTEKHTLAIRDQFDLDRGETLEFTVGLIRRFPRWYGAVSFELDQAEDDFGMSFSVWPEGLTNVALGSRRFTGLATSTRITP
jgi:hypothetical protein